MPIKPNSPLNVSNTKIKPYGTIPYPIEGVDDVYPSAASSEAYNQHGRPLTQPQNVPIFMGRGFVFQCDNSEIGGGLQFNSFDVDFGGGSRWGKKDKVVRYPKTIILNIGYNAEPTYFARLISELGEQFKEHGIWLFLGFIDFGQRYIPAVANTLELKLGVSDPVTITSDLYSTEFIAGETILLHEEVTVTTNPNDFYSGVYFDYEINSELWTGGDVLIIDEYPIGYVMGPTDDFALERLNGQAEERLTGVSGGGLENMGAFTSWPPILQSNWFYADVQTLWRVNTTIEVDDNPEFIGQETNYPIAHEATGARYYFSIFDSYTHIKSGFDKWMELLRASCTRSKYCAVVVNPGDSKVHSVYIPYNEAVKAEGREQIMGLIEGHADEILEVNGIHDATGNMSSPTDHYDTVKQWIVDFFGLQA